MGPECPTKSTTNDLVLFSTSQPKNHPSRRCPKRCKSRPGSCIKVRRANGPSRSVFGPDRNNRGPACEGFSHVSLSFVRGVSDFSFPGFPAHRKISRTIIVSKQRIAKPDKGNKIINIHASAKPNTPSAPDGRNITLLSK